MRKSCASYVGRRNAGKKEPLRAGWPASACAVAGDSGHVEDPAAAALLRRASAVAAPTHSSEMTPARRRGALPPQARRCPLPQSPPRLLWAVFPPAGSRPSPSSSAPFPPWSLRTHSSEDPPRSPTTDEPHSSSAPSHPPLVNLRSKRFGGTFSFCCSSAATCFVICDRPCGREESA